MSTISGNGRGLQSNWQLACVLKSVKLTTLSKSLFQAPRWSSPRNSERANRKINGEENLSRHRPLFPDHPLIFSRAFHLRVIPTTWASLPSKAVHLTLKIFRTNIESKSIYFYFLIILQLFKQGLCSWQKRSLYLWQLWAHASQGGSCKTPGPHQGRGFFGDSFRSTRYRISREMRSLRVREAHVRHSSALVGVTSWRASSVRSEEAFGRLEDSFWRRGSSQWRKWRLLYPKGLSISGKTGIAVTWNEEFTRKILSFLNRSSQACKICWVNSTNYFWNFIRNW